MSDLHEPSRCRIVSSVLSRIADEWSAQVVMQLGSAPRLTTELGRSIGSTSRHVLTLRGLERDGLVARTATLSTPLRVDGALTELGRPLLDPVPAIDPWAFGNHEKTIEAQWAFDRR